MKLRNIYILCRNNYSVIKELEGKRANIKGRTGVSVSKWRAVLSALEKICKSEFLEAEANALYLSVPEFCRTLNSFEVTTDEWNKINAKRSALLQKMQNTIDLYEKMGMESDATQGIDIKLPHFNDFSEFVGYLQDLDFVFSKCPFLQNQNERLEFKNVDVGSTWLTFIIIGIAVVGGGSVLLNNLVAFADKCMIFNSHRLTVQKQKLELEKEQYDFEKKRNIQEYLEQLYEKQVNQAIEEMEEITGYKVENQDGDELARIRVCMEKMGNLLDKGMQIYSTIDSPEETKRLFEPLEMKYIGIENALGLIEKKDENK